MDLQDSVQRSLQNPAEESHRFAKIENLGGPAQSSKRANILKND